MILPAIFLEDSETKVDNRALAELSGFRRPRGVFRLRLDAGQRLVLPGARNDEPAGWGTFLYIAQAKGVALTQCSVRTPRYGRCYITLSADRRERPARLSGARPKPAARRPPFSVSTPAISRRKAPNSAPGAPAPRCRRDEPRHPQGVQRHSNILKIRPPPPAEPRRFDRATRRRIRQFPKYLTYSFCMLV